MKRIIAILMSVAMLVALCACGSKEDKVDNDQAGTTQTEQKIEGDLVSLIQKMYAEVDLDAETKEALSYHMIEAIPEDVDTQTYLLGTSELEYVEAAYAMPMMNAVAYQLNVFRVAEGTDIEAFKALAESSFDTMKWVCVVPEKTAVVNVGDVVMFVAGTNDMVDAMVATFQAQGK